MRFAVYGGDTPLRIAFVCFGDKQYGMGHAYRTLGVMEAARGMEYRGEKIVCRLMSNWPESSGWKLNGPEELPENIRKYNWLLDRYKPHWVVMDLLSTPKWMVDGARAIGAKIALLNGFEDKNADIVWRQDRVENLIIRQQIKSLVDRRNSVAGKKKISRVLVWGGATDEMGLCDRYLRWGNPDIEADVLTTGLAQPIVVYPIGEQKLHRVSGEDVLNFMVTAQRAITHFGVMTWELAYLGIPQVVFAKDEGHLVDAKRLEDAGYVTVCGTIGLPYKKDEFNRLVEHPVAPHGAWIDGLGAKRLVETMIRGL